MENSVGNLATELQQYNNRVLVVVAHFKQPNANGIPSAVANDFATTNYLHAFSVGN